MAYNSWSVGSFALTGGRVNAGPQPGRSSTHTAQPSGTLQSCPHDSDSTYLPMVCKCYAKYPWASLVAQMVKKTRLQCGRPGFDPWVGKRLKGDWREDPRRRAWQPTLVFLLGESPWTFLRSLMGYTVHGFTKNWTWLTNKAQHSTAEITHAEAEPVRAEDCLYNPVAPNLWDVDQYLLSDRRQHEIRNRVPHSVTRDKCSAINIIHLNHPRTIPSHPWFVEKLSSMKLVSGANDWGLLL